MTNYTFIAAASYSIAIAVVIALIRLPKMDRSYQPFIFIIITSLANELVSHMLIRHRKSNALAVNIFGFFDALLWFWQFRKWSNRHKSRRVIYLTTIGLIVLWIVENIAFQKIFFFGYVYAITFSLLLVIFSTTQLSQQIAQEKEKLLTTPRFLICSGAVLFYTFRIFIECFYAPGSSQSANFFGNVFCILSIINIIVNLLFALAVLWIPEKQKFTLPFY